MLTNTFVAGAIGAEASSLYVPGSTQMMRLRLRNTGQNRLESTVMNYAL
jgi:hypothetical protein